MQGKVDRTLDPFMLKLEPIMAQLKRGESLRDDVIREATGQPVLRLDVRIRKWFFGRGVVVKHRGGGYYLLTDREQTGQPPRRITEMVRRAARGLAEGLAVDVTKLPGEVRTSHEHHLDLIHKAAQAANGWRGESQFILGRGKGKKKIGGKK